MKVWIPKKLDTCVICKCNQATKRLIVVEWQTWCYEHGFEEQLRHLCHWCYFSAMTFFEPITLEYIERKHKDESDYGYNSDNYKDYCKKYVGQLYITEEVMKALTRCIIYVNNDIITRPDPKYKIMCSIVNDRLDIANSFLIERNVKLKHIQCINSICAIKTLYHDETSYFFIFPQDIINLLVNLLLSLEHI
jgi:hypothetical protein